MDELGIVSVNVAQPAVLLRRPGGDVISGIDKRPVQAKALGLTRLNLAGDGQADTRPTRDGGQVISGGEDATVRTWDADRGHESASWPAGHPVIGCAALPGQPLRICVGQGQGPPGLLELRTVSPSGVSIPG